jgi:hypothetical protein
MQSMTQYAPIFNTHLIQKTGDTLMIPVPESVTLAAQIAFQEFDLKHLPSGHPLEKAWDEWDIHCESKTFESSTDSLIEAAILYGIQSEKINSSNRFHVADDEVPANYLTECECHNWASMARHHVYQHKPACPHFVMEYELALMAKRQYEQLIQDIKTRREQVEGE